MNPLEDTTYTEDLLEEYRDKYRDIDPQVSMILDNARREIEHFRSQLAMTPASSPSAAPDMKSAPGPTASHNSGERELASDPALPGAGTVSSPSAVAAEREALDRLMRRVGLKLAQLYHYRLENGLWIARSSDWRVRFFGHDALYISAWRFRFRLMRPWSLHHTTSTGE